MQLTNNIIDIDDTTVEERAHVERLIREELAGNPATAASVSRATSPNSEHSNPPLHPLVSQMLPLEPSHSTPILLQDIERYEEEEPDDEEGDQQHSIVNGIDMSKYTEFADANDEIHYDRLYTTLSHSMIQERNLGIASSQQGNIVNQQAGHLQKIRKFHDDMASDLQSKRESVDEINHERKRRQIVDFKPVNDYLQRRWKDGLKNVVDLGIETAIISEKMDIE